MHVLGYNLSWYELDTLDIILWISEIKSSLRLYDKSDAVCVNKAALTRQTLNIPTEWM